MKKMFSIAAILSFIVVSLGIIGPAMSEGLSDSFYVTAAAGASRVQDGPAAGEEGTALSASIGLKATDWLGVEAGYTELDRVGTFKPKGYSVSAVAGKTIAGFVPYGRVGAFKNDHGDASPLLGLGVGWKMVTLEYQRIEKMNVGTGEDAVDVLLLGLTF